MTTNKETLLEEMRQELWELTHKNNPQPSDVEKIHELSKKRTLLIEKDL